MSDSRRSSTAPTSTALRGRLVLPDRLEPDGVVEVVGDRLGYVGPAGGWDGPTEPVGTVAPGFVDVHCHGGGGSSVTTGVPDDVAAVAAHHLRHGTTSMLASLVTATPARIGDAVAAVAEVAGAGGSAVVGSHLEGPFLGPGHCGAHDADLLLEPDAALVEDWLDRGRGTVRMLTLAPELPRAGEVAALLAGRGVLVALGHTDADAAGFAGALATPHVSLVTHLFNGMSPMHHRRPGPVAASLASLATGGTHVELIADGLHLADETVSMVFAVDPGGHVVLVSDAMSAAGMPDGDYRLGPLDVRVEDGVARTLTPDGPGPIAGSTVHLADAVRRCVVHAGVDPVLAVRAATSTPARLLGLDDRGRLATGLRADLVVLDDGWHVTRVLRGGVEPPL